MGTAMRLGTGVSDSTVCYKQHYPHSIFVQPQSAASAQEADNLKLCTAANLQTIVICWTLP